MEIETQDSVPQQSLVKVRFRLGSESHMIDVGKGSTVVEQLVSMKEESMRILKEFITKHNVPDDVPDDLAESPSDEDGEDVSEKCSVKSKKTKLTQLLNSMGSLRKARGNILVKHFISGSFKWEMVATATLESFL